MHSVPVLVLISVLQFCISFPAVAGDCYDDPLGNNRSYDNCDSCYQTLVNALINTGDNKYLLGKTFFPDNDVRPVEVTINYLCVSDDTNCTTVSPCTNCTTKKCDTTWYWILGEFFVFQPLNLFMYRSLFFSQPRFRQKSVNISLPYQCFNCSDDKYYEFFGYLTQRLRLYASSQSATAEVSDMYVGKAINKSHSPLGDDDLMGSVGRQIIPVVYALPFSVVFVFFIISVISLCACQYECKVIEGNGCLKGTPVGEVIKDLKIKDKIKKFKSEFANDHRVQANLVAVTILCCIFTLYAFGLDIASVREENAKKFPEYFHTQSYGFYAMTILFTSLSLLFHVIGIILFCIVWLHNVILPHKKKWEVYIPMLFCIGSALLSFSFHFQSILIAWSTDPFYASRIALFYGFVIFTYFICLKYAYSFPLKLLRRNEDPSQKDRWNKCELITVVISLFVTTVVWSGIIVTVTIFIIYVPINNSIEHSVTGLTTIFNGAIILIGGFVAYSVGIHYFGNPFSLKDALKKAMNEMEKTPFSPGNNGNWNRLTEEKRMTEVIKALIHHQTLSRPQYSTLYSALISVLMKACNNKEPINPHADQVVTLSTVLYDAITTAVRTAAGNDVVKINTLTSALVKVLNNPQFVLDSPHIDLAEIPTEEMLKVLRNDLQNHIDAQNLSVNEDGIRMELTIALIPLLSSVIANVIKNAHKNGQNINPPADQVVTLSTVLYDPIDTAVRAAAGNNAEDIHTLTSALVGAMSNPEFVLDGPHIDLAEIPTEEMLKVLQNDIQNHINAQNLRVDRDGIRMDLTIALIPLPSVIANVLKNAHKNGQKINPSADQVVTLSTVLYDHINTAVRTAAGNNAANIRTLTGALFDIMNNPQFVLDGPHIDLVEIPTEEMLKVLRNDVQNHINAQNLGDVIRMDLTIALFAPLPSALANVLRNACNNGQKINPAASEVFVLTTALYNDIMPAVQNATLINALIPILSTITLNDPNIDLAHATAQPNLNNVGQRIVAALNIRQANPQQAIYAITTAIIDALK